MCTKLKKSGLGSTDHHPTICEEDMAKLYGGNHHAFDVNTPVVLQQKVWFEIVYYLCRRGRENQRAMSKDTFQVGVDASGRKFVYQAVDESDKNHNERDKPEDTVGEGRMYQVMVSPVCPVSSFKTYLLKLHPSCNDLWQRPLDSFVKEEVWFCNSPMGKNPLGKMMRNISIMAKLSKHYKCNNIG
jgi:hypothetical protein